jgi:hypothetical protein
MRKRYLREIQGRDYSSPRELVRELKDLAFRMDQDGYSEYVEEIISVYERLNRFDNVLRQAARDLGLYEA